MPDSCPIPQTPAGVAGLADADTGQEAQVLGPPAPTHPLIPPNSGMWPNRPSPGAVWGRASRARPGQAREMAITGI